MILPFSRSRSRTSLISNCLYCASFTPRAMFSKSMNNASFRSPFMDAYYMGRFRDGAHPLRALEVMTHEAGRSIGGGPRSPGPDLDREVARADIRSLARVRSQALELPVLRSRGARDELELGRDPGAAAREGALRRPLRHPVVQARQRVGG